MKAIAENTRLKLAQPDPKVLQFFKATAKDIIEKEGELSLIY